MAFVGRPRTADTSARSGLFNNHTSTHLADALSGASSAYTTGRGSHQSSYTGDDNNNVQQSQQQVHYAPTKSPYATRPNPDNNNNNSSFTSQNNHDTSFSSHQHNNNSSRRQQQAAAGKDFYGGIRLSTFHEQEVEEQMEIERLRNQEELRQKFQKLEGMLMPGGSQSANARLMMIKKQQQQKQQQEQDELQQQRQLNSSSSYTSSASYYNNNNTTGNNISPVRHHLSKDPELMKSPGDRFAVFRLPPHAAAEAGLPEGSSVQVPMKNPAYLDRLKYEYERDERQRELRDVLNRLEGQAEQLQKLKKKNPALADEYDAYDDYFKSRGEQNPLLADAKKKNKNKKKKKSKRNNSKYSSSSDDDGSTDDDDDENSSEEEDDDEHDDEYRAMVKAKKLQAKRGRRENPLLKTQYGKDVLKKIDAFNTIHDNVPIRRRKGENDREFQQRLNQYERNTNNNGSRRNGDDDLPDSSFPGDDDNDDLITSSSSTADYFNGGNGKGASSARGTSTSSMSTSLPYHNNNNNKSRRNNNPEEDPLNLTMDKLSGRDRRRGGGGGKSSSRNASPAASYHSLGGAGDGAGGARTSSGSLSPTSLENDASVRRRLHKHHGIRQLHLQEEENEMRTMIESTEANMRNQIMNLLVEQLRTDWEHMKMIHDARNKFIATKQKMHDERTNQRLQWRAGTINQTVDEIAYLRSVSPMRSVTSLGGTAAASVGGQQQHQQHSFSHQQHQQQQQSLNRTVSPSRQRSNAQNSFPRQNNNNNENNNSSFYQQQQHNISTASTNRPPLMNSSMNNNNNNNMSRGSNHNGGGIPLSPQQKREYKHKLMQDLLAAPLHTAQAVSP